MENLELLVRELCKLPSETEYLEFKTNNYDPEMIGQNICALANSACLLDRENAYMVWGINDKNHIIEGTDIDKFSKLKGNQEIYSWLRQLCSDNFDFSFNKLVIDGKKVLLLLISRPYGRPATFKKDAYIRIGSYTKLLKDAPREEASLWDKLRQNRFEIVSAMENLSCDDIFNYLDFSQYFDLQNIQYPDTKEKALHYILEDEIVKKQDNGLYSISNMGAILFAKKLDNFPSVKRKAIRVVQYEDDTKFKILKEFNGIKGYVVGFEGLMEFLEALLPSVEEITGTFRKQVTKYPMVALREIIANALIHQDFTILGAGPIVEIFNNRIEITNPGIPLVDIKRIIDNPPKSRNEKLAALMRRLKICEELGSGWDRIAYECETKLLPAPKIQLYDENIKVILFAKIPFANITKEEKLWTCYMHACLKQVSRDGLTNSSLRERFGLDSKSSAPISRLIKEAVSAELIKVFDPDTAPRYMKYIPYWA